MKASRNWKTITGWVLHGLVGGIMFLAASAKVLGLFPQEQVENLRVPGTFASFAVSSLAERPIANATKDLVD